MTSVKFFYCNNMMIGFELSGHSTVDENDEMGKLVCTAISSAVYLTANTLTDILNCKCNINESDGYFKLMLLNNEDKAQATLNGFKLHIEGLKEEYKSHLKISTEEK